VPERLLVTKNEAAERLGVSVRTIERLVAAGRLPQVHVERLARFRVTDLEAFTESLGQEQDQRPDAEGGNEQSDLVRQAGPVRLNARRVVPKKRIT
jgi:excisionase family DNA binding protein